MANRAYLYSSDQSDAWTRPEEDYYDSRWWIPLAWFFFYRPHDIRLADVHHRNSHWQEVKFSTEKQSALALFAARELLLLALIEERISRATVTAFLATVERWRGRFLLLDPESVLGGMPGDDPMHARRFAGILTMLGPNGGAVEVVREAMRPYVGDFDPDPDRCLGQIIGYTYW